MIINKKRQRDFRKNFNNTFIFFFSWSLNDKRLMFFFCIFWFDYCTKYFCGFLRIIQGVNNMHKKIWWSTPWKYVNMVSRERNKGWNTFSLKLYESVYTESVLPLHGKIFKVQSTIKF